MLNANEIIKALSNAWDKKSPDDKSALFLVYEDNTEDQLAVSSLNEIKNDWLLEDGAGTSYESYDETYKNKAEFIDAIEFAEIGEEFTHIHVFDRVRIRKIRM